MIRDAQVRRDANGDIGDHLHSHIHLTNCFHLKNHMSKKSPTLAHRSSMRDLVALQRSRSMRDPSLSPSARQSPVVNGFLRRVESDPSLDIGRRSVGVDYPRNFRGVPPMVPHCDVSGDTDRTIAVNENRRNRGLAEYRRGKREVLSVDNIGADSVASKDEILGNGDSLICELVSGNSQGLDRVNRQRGKIGLSDQPKSIPRQLKEFSADAEDAPSHSNSPRVLAQSYRFSDVAEATTHPGYGNRKRGRRRRFRAAKRTRASTTSIDSGAKNKIYVASNLFAQGAKDQICHCMEAYDAYGRQNVSSGPRNGCGIPFNWSRIHHKGKLFIDRAGRSLSRGLSDSRFVKGTMHSTKKDNWDIPSMSNYSGSSSKPDAEGLPLLLSASVSQGSTGNAYPADDYSGKLGFCTDNIIKREIDSDLSSEAWFGVKHKYQGNVHGRHQSLTQKYMPRTFRDLVGQHLVVQALSNAVVESKVGLLYVFYGPNGTGKTSTARIFAKALNCHSLEPPKPCGVCKSCVAHDSGKSRNIKEVGPMSNIDNESIMYVLDDMVVSQPPSECRVLIFDDCETLTNDCWSTIVKVVDRAPRQAVFVLVCSSLDVVPYIIISRCQRFFFPKLKDADIIYALQWISTKENLQIDKDALKLIASKSSGSLRDAEMTLEQLSLLGQRISVPLVQEMVGLISDEKIVDLLDFALSADTVNTVKNLRDIMESSVDPLALIPQLATVITDILSGGYNFNNKYERRKFFQQQTLSKEDKEKLRHALKTLSEAEKHLRMSNDRLTWLTAVILQLAPEQQSLLPYSSADTSCNSPLRETSSGDRERSKKSNVGQSERSNNKKALSEKSVIDSQDITSGDTSYDANCSSIITDSLANRTTSDRNRASGSQLIGRYYGEIENIWSDILEQIRVNSIKEFLSCDGKLISVSSGAAPTVQLAFSSEITKSTADRFKTFILQACESVLGSPVTLEIQRQSIEQQPLILLSSTDETSQIDVDFSCHGRGVMRGPLVNCSATCGSEIVELDASPIASNVHATIERNVHLDLQNRRSSIINGTAPVQNRSSIASFADQKQSRGRNQDLTLVKGKVSLRDIIQHSEGCSQQSGWSRRKAVSIAKMLEQENLKMEARWRSLFCWKVPKMSHKKKKPSRWKIRIRHPQRFLKFMTCGKCMCMKSPSR